MKKFLEVKTKKEQIFLTCKSTMPRELKVYANKQLYLRSDLKDDQLYMRRRSYCNDSNHKTCWKTRKIGLIRKTIPSRREQSSSQGYLE